MRVCLISNNLALTLEDRNNYMLMHTHSTPSNNGQCMYNNLSKIRPWAMNLSSVSKRGVGDIFESCDISLEKTLPTSHAVSQALFMHALVILQCLFCHALIYAITANSVFLHLLVPPLLQSLLLNIIPCTAP